LRARATIVAGESLLHSGQASVFPDTAFASRRTRGGSSGFADSVQKRANPARATERMRGVSPKGRLRVSRSGANLGPQPATKLDPAADRARTAGDKRLCSEERARVVAKPLRHRDKWRIRWLDEHGKRQSAVFDDYRRAQTELSRHQVEVEEIKRGVRNAAPPEKTFGDLCDYSRRRCRGGRQLHQRQDRRRGALGQDRE